MNLTCWKRVCLHFCLRLQVGTEGIFMQSSPVAAVWKYNQQVSVACLNIYQHCVIDFMSMGVLKACRGVMTEKFRVTKASKAFWSFYPCHMLALQCSYVCTCVCGYCLQWHSTFLLVWRQIIAPQPKCWHLRSFVTEGFTAHYMISSFNQMSASANHINAQWIITVC